MIFSKYIVWIFLFIAGTIYIYFLGLKKDWQELRIKKGLEKDMFSNPPKLKDKSKIFKYRYSKTCISLLLASSAASAFIVITFFVTSEKNEINPRNALSNMVAIFSLFSFIVEAPSNKKSLVEKYNEQPFYKIFAIIAPIKYYIIEGLVVSEHDYILNFIKSKIKKWYDKNDVEIGTLIIRIDSNFFNRMLPDDSDEEVKELMVQDAYNILKLYKRGAPFYDELIKLIPDLMLEHNASLLKLGEFIDNNEIECKKQSISKIKKYILENTEPAVNKSKKKVYDTKKLEEIFEDHSLKAELKNVASKK